MYARLWPGAALLGVALIGLLYAERREDARLRWIFKPLASTGFVVAAVQVGAHTHTYGQAVLLGLVLSWLGDVLLIPKTGRWFLFGLLAFLLAHVAYGLAFVAHGVEVRITALAAVAMALVGVPIARWLLPKVPENLKIPVTVYILVIASMVALSVGARGAGATLLVPLSAVAFWLSDMSVARDRFDGAGFTNRLWGLPLYYVAQLGFAATAAAL